ncbi:tyrosine-type recombinase/integrase [Pseudoalteromonas rhizosphaerae]|uniref:tyrosine-type recombinase/integrase n=1 Tax=Pseudoalteromonas rhizosphaerae TaxID=2518973 RepID=UPI00237F66AC|nr:tyrosine-type recombinase/integrase [Pseudoalteromonas rhizosphaerae]
MDISNSFTITPYNIFENGDLVIFKQTSSNWWAQIKTPPELGFKNNRVRFSTGCKIGTLESFIEAVNFAKKRKNKHDVLLEEGLPLSDLKPTVKQVALKVIDEFKKEKLHDKTKKGYLRIIENQIIPVLGNCYIKNLGLNELIDFFDQRDTGNSDTQTTMTKTALDRIYVYALKKKMIVQADRPLWKDIKIETTKSKKRLTFRKVDVDSVDKNIDLFIGKSTNKKVKANRNLFKFYIKFIENTGTRPGDETTGIKWKHIFQSEFKNEARTTIFLEKGKMGDRNKTREIHIDRKTYQLLTQLYFKKFKSEKEIAFLFKHANGIPSNDFMQLKQDHGNEYIFARSCGKTPDYCDVWKQYRTFLKKKLTEDKFTLYSFRHYFITKKLHQEIDVYKLAKYVGNSPTMIRDYYDGSFSALASEFVMEDLNQENLNIFE